MRYKVVKVGIPTTSSPFTIVLAITNQSFSNGRLLSSEQGSILIKAGNGSNTQTFLTSTPAVVDKPSDPLPNVSSFQADPNPLISGQCATLTWIGTNITSVAITPNDCVTISGNAATICPTNTTSSPIYITYTLTATGLGGTTTSTTTLMVDPVPPPVVMPIDIARETIEKRNDSGAILGYVTYYFKDGVPACSCVTETNDQILAFPCEINPLPANCNLATTSDSHPVLVCLPFPDKTEAELLATCSDGTGGIRANCAVVQVSCPPEHTGNCYAKCDLLNAVTAPTTMQIGQNTCCAKTSTCCTRTLSGVTKCSPCTTWVACSASETCP